MIHLLLTHINIKDIIDTTTNMTKNMIRFMLSSFEKLQSTPVWLSQHTQTPKSSYQHSPNPTFVTRTILVIAVRNTSIILEQRITFYPLDLSITPTQSNISIIAFASSSSLNSIITNSIIRTYISSCFTLLQTLSSPGQDSSQFSPNRPLTQSPHRCSLSKPSSHTHVPFPYNPSKQLP